MNDNRGLVEWPVRFDTRDSGSVMDIDTPHDILTQPFLAGSRPAWMM